MRIEPAIATDVDAALEALVAAFAADPLMHWFYADHPRGQRQANREFFAMLMRARLALDMPVMVAREGRAISGAVMGYTATDPEWPAPLAADWDAWVAAAPGLSEKFDAYEAISVSAAPRVPHYYLGVIGVDPRVQGTGTGRNLLEAFVARSAADAASQGVYLETSNPASLAFYRKCGFEVTGEGRLEDLRLWCVFRPHASRHPVPDAAPD
ncbi:MAG: GNAT family N-acetyltransferase [Betaproteobacteria bacterium]|nr:GNAT family N-acetyltransferase [Betaproteobacteria bacterium]